MNESFFEAHAESEDLLGLLERMGAGLGGPGRHGLTPEEIVGGLVARTPSLTSAERAALLASVAEQQGAETAPRAPSAGAARGGASRPAAPSAGARSSAAARPAAPGASRGSAAGSAGRPAAGGSARSPAPSGQPARPGRGQPGSRPERSGSSFDLGRIVSGIRTGLDTFQQAAQVVSAFTGPPGGSAPPPSGGDGSAPAVEPPGPASAPDGGAAPAPGLPAGYPPPQAYAAPPGAYGLPPGVYSPYGPAAPAAPFGAGAAGPYDVLGALLQALRPGHIPALPGVPQGAIPAPGAPGASLDATAMLGLLIGNPQLQQALQWAAVLGPHAPRAMQLQVPSAAMPGALRRVAVPLAPALAAISRLAAEAIGELEANVSEGDPETAEYLVGEDGELLVDPASAEERAAAAVHLLRLSREAERARSGGSGAKGRFDDDDPDAWAREAGWIG